MREGWRSRFWRVDCHLAVVALVDGVGLKEKALRRALASQKGHIDGRILGMIDRIDEVEHFHMIVLYNLMMETTGTFLGDETSDQIRSLHFDLDPMEKVTSWECVPAFSCFALPVVELHLMQSISTDMAKRYGLYSQYVFLTNILLFLHPVASNAGKCDVMHHKPSKLHDRTQLVLVGRDSLR